MNVSHAYGAPPSREDAEQLFHRAFDLGIRHFDTASLYGFGRNEELVGSVLSSQRSSIYLASKCGMTGVDGRRVIDGRPDTLKRTCHESLQRLRTDVIDLYYLHRWDKNVPIEDSVGALAELVTAGHIRGIGLSEVSATTLRKAHAVHPITAVQSEYSIWTRNPEIAVLDECRRLGIAFVAFSPLGRGFLTDADVRADALLPKDIRREMPRFQEPDCSANLALLHRFRELAIDEGCTAAQLALAWVLHRGNHILPIVGTTSITHLEENLGATTLRLDERVMAQVDECLNARKIRGRRYNQATQSEIDTEEF
jgi:aryl-alcohol dehydrogenase-like predicted oxidoreductase